MVATTVLTGRVSSTGRLPVPGKQVADAIDGMVGDAGEHVAEISLRIELAHFCGLCRPPNYAERFWMRPIVCANLRPVERTSPKFHSA